MGELLLGLIDRISYEAYTFPGHPKSLRDFFLFGRMFTGGGSCSGSGGRPCPLRSLIRRAMK
jgi:hypothetical protein